MKTDDGMTRRAMMAAAVASGWAALGLQSCRASAQGPATKSKALRFGKLITGQGQVVTDAVVVVQGDRVTGVASGDAAVPGDAEVIDLRRFTGIPGLIDVHTHMTYYYDPASGGSPLRTLRTL